MRKLFLTTTLVVGYVIVSFACTNLLVGKKASADGSTLISYAADSYGLYENYTTGLHDNTGPERC